MLALLIVLLVGTSISSAQCKEIAKFYCLVAEARDIGDPEDDVESLVMDSSTISDGNKADLVKAVKDIYHSKSSREVICTKAMEVCK